MVTTIILYSVRVTGKVSERAILCAMLLWCCFSIQEVECFEITFVLRGIEYPPHGLVNLEDITTTRGLGCIVECTTNCISTAARRIKWYKPNQMEILRLTSVNDQPNTFRGMYGVKVVENGFNLYLYREDGVTEPEGVWKCEVRNQITNETLNTSYIGVYQRNTMTGSVVTTQSGLHYSVVSEDPLMFTLTLNTSGGPATYVTWTRDGVDITTLSDMTYSTTRQPILVSSGDRGYRYANYTITLTVTGRHPGVYEVNVTNDRNGPGNAVVKNITLKSVLPTNLIVTRAGPTTIRVSWKQPPIIRPSGYNYHNYQLTLSLTNCTSQVNMCTMVTNVTKFDVDSNMINPKRVYIDDQLSDWSIIIVNIIIKLEGTVSSEPGYAYLPSPPVASEFNLTGWYAPDSESSSSSSVIAGVMTVLVLIILGVVVTLATIGAFLLHRHKQKSSEHTKSTLKFIGPGSLSKSDASVLTPDMKTKDAHKPKSSECSPADSEVSKWEMKIPNHTPPIPGKRPSIKEFPEDIHVTEGQKVVLEVTVSGQPEPSLTWYHNGEELVADYSLEIDQDGRVYIPSAELHHSGVYKLVVKNDRGRDERELTVLVHSESEGIYKKKMDLSPVPVDEFGSYVTKHHECFHEGFKDMFQCLYDGSDHSTKIGLSPKNKKLNRFANITVYDDNRIELNSSEGCKNTFVNACYVDGYLTPRKYIATQGPLPTTVNEFWRLVLQEKVSTIVMITNLKEGDKVKCHQYWPDSGSQVYGPVEVTVSDQKILADYVIRTFFIKSVDIKQLKVTQYHFTSWPDHGVPTYATSVLTFHKRATTEHKQRAKKGPMLVHCSAGVGRTGTFIAIDWVLKQVEKEKIVDIAGTVNKMRQQRMKMVQTADQFVFIHDAILESVTCGNTQINVADLRLAVKRMLKTDPTTKKTHFELQFDVLEQMSPNPKDSQKYCSSALKYPEKNRKMEYLPAENYRVGLIGEYPDYINATNVNGYKQKNAYIIAEGPMESTVRNFWKMICDRKCGAIIMLSDIIEHGEETSCQYWPCEEEKARFGEYTIELIKEEMFDDYTTRKLSVTMKKKPAHEVMQFHITNWGVDGKCNNLSSITEVIEKVTKAQMRSGNKPIVVHCSDTVGRSGMFCAISSAIEQCKSEGVVDVFQVIKAMRVQKPGAVLNVEQYQVVYDAVLTFLDSYDMYANFQRL